MSGISGDKTQTSWGSLDYWIVKTDSLGNKQWDKDFGGTELDDLLSIQETNDYGFILGGYSLSGISGDKTEGLWGNYDFWIIKTDSLGNKQWDTDLGGTENDWLGSVLITSDGGYLFGGTSASPISGNKTQSTKGGWDYWVVKTDALGNIEWDRDFGGSNEEELWSIIKTTDGGYLISGDSYSAISGNKTENNLGQEQTWVLKIDSLGNILWEKTLFTNGHDECGSAIEVSDGCYLMGNTDDGIAGGYKSFSTWGSYDYWLIKFCETLQANFTSPSSFCPGTCVDFTNLSFQSTSYLWSFPGATPDTSTVINPSNICYATPGTYDVQLIATNANGSDTLLLVNYITVYPFPPSQSITQSGDTLFAITGSASYQWYFNTNLINGATDYFYVASSSGDYNVVATDANGCEVEAAIFNVVASLQSTVDRGLLTIFPNPVEDKFTMHNAQCMMRTAIEISIYNVLGEKVYLPVDRIPIAIGMLTVDCRHLPSGIYYLEITAGEKTFRTKFVKK